jgi:hypothetical protein
LVKRDGAAVFTGDLQKDHVKPAAVTLVFKAADSSVNVLKFRKPSKPWVN